MTTKPGPTATGQLKKLSEVWEQGQHVVVSGATGSGKTTLARQVIDIRLRRGGHVVVFLAKLQEDKTITDDYKGFTRWSTWKNPRPQDKRILLIPDVSKCKTGPEVRAKQREVFFDALNKIQKKGHWTVVIDEGLYMCAPSMINLAAELEMLNILGRSAGITTVINMQRPANVPLVFYGSASHAFVGRARELNDLKRLSELGGKQTAKELQGRLSSQGKHDFLWIPVHEDWEPETVNLRK